MAVPTAAGSAGLGILALLLGIAGLLLSCFFSGFYLGIPALIVGVIGVRLVADGRARGRGMALTGVILGACAVLVSTGALIAAIALWNSPMGKCALNAGDNSRKVHQCVSQNR
ncbi:hypothetical protein GCM10009765_18470 [Fodinicola feengrottensis]|uniref:DUF4190 domain-containing protein n=1 Tax=Fodinicola feengrottensis TaxID=435914 RepID=A0ABP4S925_9ACTN